MSSCFINVGGGVGNQLFQIATGYAYAKEHDKELFIDTHEWTASQGRHPNEYRETIFKNFKYGDTSITRRISEKSNKYEKLPYEQNSVSLHGYFQSLKYFEDCVEEFKSILSIQHITTDLINDRDVAFHIRRGDYINYSHIYGIGDKYFNDRFEEFRGCNINVFTDSPEIVLREFEKYDFRLIQTKSEITDLTLISQHDNVVCSNSSFSWWASLLGKKKNQIIVPDIWMNGQDCSDIYRDDMIIKPTS